MDKKKPLFKRWWLIVVFFVLLFAFINWLITPIDDSNEIEADDSTEVINEEVGAEEIESENNEYTPPTEYTATEDDVLSSLDDFEQFTINYELLEPSERTNLWNNEIQGTEVTWTGRLIYVGHDSLYLRADGPYLDGEDWAELDGYGRYQVFISDFGEDIDDEDYKLGTEFTVTGSLDSRGSPDLGFEWKLYDAEIVD